MDRNEAKVLLMACRSNGQDDALPAFAEALALAARDPELKTWWEAQQAFDRKISRKLIDVPVPAELQARILSRQKTEQITPRFQVPTWLAIAAALAILCMVGAGAIFRSSLKGDQNLTSARYDEKSIAFLGDDSPSLATTSPDHATLIKWLKERNSPTGTIPASMASTPSVGCQTFSMHGHHVSLICFAMADGKIVHLFTVEKGALSDPPGDTPSFKQNGNWSTASWSDKDKTYLLVTQAGPSELRQLL